MKFKELEIFHLWKTEPKRGISSSYLCRLRKQTIDMERGQKSEWIDTNFVKNDQTLREMSLGIFGVLEKPKNEEDEVDVVNGEGEFDPWYLCSVSGSIWVKTGSISIQKIIVGLDYPGIDRSSGGIDRSRSYGFSYQFDVSFGLIDPLLGSIDPVPAGFLINSTSASDRSIPS